MWHPLYFSLLACPWYNYSRGGMHLFLCIKKSSIMLIYEFRFLHIQCEDAVQSMLLPLPMRLKKFRTYIYIYRHKHIHRHITPWPFHFNLHASFLKYLKHCSFHLSLSCTLWFKSCCFSFLFSFFKEIYIFIQYGCIKLTKVTVTFIMLKKDFYFK